MHSYILDFQAIDKAHLAMVGGKGANLGELSRMEGVHVPEGFCVATEAYKEIMKDNTKLHSLLNQLALLGVDNGECVSEASATIRKLIEETAIPNEVAHEITHHIGKLGEENAYAVRSSATAEDLPTASFAGQQDTYLNIIGSEAILRYVSKCWASLFTDRAVIYRMRHGIDHRTVSLSVIIQKMVFPDSAGVMFTSDPVTGNRKIVSIDASFGLGEALVSGLVNADTYKVREGKIIDKKISTKTLAIHAPKEGGTKKQEIEPGRQNAQTLTDEQMLQLERLGRKIEKHFGRPQDIEWCLVYDAFYIVQSRPITTLFPIPEVNDQKNHVYLSVGHQQMMTDALKPLGISVWQLTAARPMLTAGGRLFVDVAEQLASPAGRNMLVNVLGQSDPLIQGALVNIIERGDFIPSLPDEKKEQSYIPGKKDAPPVDFQTLNDYDPTVVADLIKRSEISIETLQQNIQTKSGSDVFDLIREDIDQLKKSLSDPKNVSVIMTSMNAASWINANMQEWLGEKNVADTLSQSVSNNITSEMGLALLDVADVIRPYPELIRYLRHMKDENFLDELVKFNGGQESKDAIRAYLDKYGMRGVGEIDITRTRWSEKPTTLVPLILSNIKNFEPHASQRKFEQGRRVALKKEQEVLDRLKRLPGGEQKAEATKRMIGLIRNLAGYREYPKYSIVSRYFVYKQALLKEAERLVQAGVIHEKEDVYYLTFEELSEVVRTHILDGQIISARKAEYQFYEKLTPPRVITSDGEIIASKYTREHLPAEALIGLPVSSGVVEGRAHVIFRMEDADLEEGDILVTPFTDPSWTPLFVSVKGLVTEVGGLMTHGAVIAREYGLPAVVGVENATKLIKDGQRIRVHGTEGYVEII